MKRLSLLTLLIVLISTPSSLFGQDNFYAYYTKVVHTSTDYFGKYADLIVVLGEGRQLEFTRRTQYIPLWVTPQGSFPVDDFFPGRDKDFEFNYNYVRLIERKPDKIVVHWRYIPDVSQIELANADLNPTFIEGFTGVVHELFTIYPSGKVEREVKDARGSRIETWKKEQYADRQTLQLTDDGIEHGRVRWGDKSKEGSPPVAKNPVISTKGLKNPVLMWKFDEGGKDFPGELAEEAEEIIDMTIESVSEDVSPVSGHMTVYKKGVSGTSLAFDGYYTGFAFDEELPKITDALTLEAWIALDVYPFNEAPIIHKSTEFGKTGFYLGVDPYGKLMVRVNGAVAKSSGLLPLYTWTHVAATVGNGFVSLWLDGELVAETEFKGAIDAAAVPYVIGINTERKRCTDYVREPDQNIPFIYGVQGLLDEVKVYDQLLSERQIRNHFTTFLPKDVRSPLEKAVLPGEVGVAEKFGANYKTLKFHELWDNMWRLTDYADIVVKFDDNPASVIYWHGTNFAPNWVTDNNRWMADQSSEIFTKHGCSEHMADKQTRHSYARIIENNPARVIIHWRYPCVDVGYICTDRRNWTDEYHTIYPDGTAVRKVVFNNTEPPGFQDIQFFTNPGETALDVVNINAMTVANIEGDLLELVWEKPNKNPQQTLQDASIEWLNSKSEYKVYTIFQGPGITTWGSFEQSKYTDDPFAGPWNHWPVSLLPSDGRFAVAHDRVTHFALGANDDTPFLESLVHYGFTKENVNAVIPVAKYWQNPPTVANVEGGTCSGFSKAEKVYYFSVQDAETLSFKINAGKKSPVVNPAFAVQNCRSDGLKIKVNGKSVQEGKGLRIGGEYDGNGKSMTILWLKYESETPVTVEISL